jgi:hypothetical protein
LGLTNKHPTRPFGGACYSIHQTMRYACTCPSLGRKYAAPCHIRCNFGVTPWHGYAILGTQHYHHWHEFRKE